MLSYQQSKMRISLYPNQIYAISHSEWIAFSTSPHSTKLGGTWSNLPMFPIPIITMLSITSINQLF
jgi:hypothetical protein